MFRHVVLFRFNPESTNAQHDAIYAALRNLPGLIPELRAYHVGPDAGLVDGNWDATAVADFDDVEGWRAYTANGDHQKIIAELIRPILADRAAVQYELRG